MRRTYGGFWKRSFRGRRPGAGPRGRPFTNRCCGGGRLRWSAWGRGCLDAIEAIYWTLNGKHTKRQWILDADLKAAFDKIGHAHLLGLLEGFPARDLIRQWLKAGVVERDRLTPTEEGTPQGGVISP